MYGIDVSNYVSSFNTAFYFVVVISLIFLVALTFLMLYFIFRYNRKKNSVATQIEGNLPLEIIWTVVPIILAMAMFHFGWAGWKPTRNAPDNSMEVTSIARMWSFTFTYDNGKKSQDLVVPVNTPVKIKLVSLDVIHSLFIPAFRIKSDMIPGQEKMMWFLPKIEGEYDLYCAEYCGLRHSYMNAMVKVLSKEDYEKWYTDSLNIIQTETGAVAAVGSAGIEIIRTQGCTACHSSDGSKLVGPSFLNIYGHTVTVVKDGKDVSLTVDDEYLKRSIIDPNVEIVKGYPPGLMQSYKDVLSEDEIVAIIEYLKTLNEK